jgi:hypothetical protein
VAGVGGLEVAVGLVQGVTDPVAGQVGRLAADVAAGQVAPWRVLVDVVAQVQDHVEVVLGQVPVGGVVALLEVLAGHEGQVQANEGAARVGAGPGAADPAQVAAGPEAVPVVAARVEAVHLHVDGVGQGRGGGDAAPADHVPEPRPGGDLPVDRDRPGRHAAAGVERPGRQPGPEHRPGRGRVAGGHPEGERVVRPGARGGPGPRDPLGREQGGGAGRPGQEQAATDRRRGRGGLIGWGDVRHDQAPLGRLEAADHSGSRERWPGRVGQAAAQGTVCGQTRRVGRSGTTCGQPRERLASVRYASPPGALAPRGGISVRPRRWWARAGGPNGRTT